MMLVGRSKLKLLGIVERVCMGKTHDVRANLPSGDSVHSNHSDGIVGIGGCGGLL